MHTELKDSEPSETDELQQNQKSFRTFSVVTDLIPARLVLYFLSWSGFLVSFMMRNDINFALVAMVRQTSSDNDTMLSVSNSNRTSTINNNGDGEFDWSLSVQSIIQGSFYWCYVLSQVAGGVATQYFGTKNVFGWSQFATAICSLGIPYAATLHWGVLVVLRSIQGFASGLTWPAMYAIVGYWIPPIERSRFMSSFQGFSIGIGLTYPLCGFIISHWGWRIVFYTTGTIGMVWCILWYFFAFNTPEIHPRITKSELEYIQLNISQDIKDGQGMKVPWLDIFKSLPVWSIGITTFGRIWIHYTFIMFGPMYMSSILGFSIQENGLLTGIPFLCSYLSSVIFCWIADILIKNNYLSLTNCRKLFTAISQIIPGILILTIGVLNQNIIFVLIIWFIAVSLITASYAGAMANIVDIAPNLAGPVLAFAQTIHMTASFLQPLITGLIISDQKSLNQWCIVFGVTSIISISTYVMYQVYATGDIQSWNYPPKILISANETATTTTITDDILSPEINYFNDDDDDNSDNDDGVNNDRKSSEYYKGK